MERRRQPEPPPTPHPDHRSSVPFLHDISNYKTPLPHFRNGNPKPIISPLFFTASKNTPTSASASSTRRSSLRRKPFTHSLPQSKAARRLMALELEQSKSARKAESQKAKTLKSFSRSVTAWLNFLFENPKECGCKVEMGSDGSRGCKRQKNCKEDEEDVVVVLSAERVSALRESLKNVCSLEDLKARMRSHMSIKGCNEVLLVMSKLCKSIDDGRLKMKAHCPIVTDLALKEKSTKVLMCYNPTWLRIGLHFIFGGELLLNECGKPDQEDVFLKLIIENQFFAHMSVARSYAYNKFVEGVYRPGFFEALGNILLKRFLLLVISLDKAKCESALPMKCGIDGIDGGSPLLFSRHSHIKSSRQAVKEILSEAMHGEGDLLSHLVILGCKLNYQQSPLAEYEFNIRNLFEDFQDGIMLCRAVQLLKSDASVLSKVSVPADSHKKRLQNCSTAMMYLKHAGVSLSDGDGMQIAPEDIVNADKELVLSILWNMFLHLQVPLLIDRTLLAKEIAKIEGSDMVLSNYEGKTELDLLLSWIENHAVVNFRVALILFSHLKKLYNKHYALCMTLGAYKSICHIIMKLCLAVCKWQCIEVDGFSSIIEKKALSGFIDYYFRHEAYRYSSKDNQIQCGEELIGDFDTNEVHSYAFIQSLSAIPGSFPKVFQLSDLLDQDASYDESSVVILVVFLASRLICRKNTDDLKYKYTQQNYRYTDVKSSLLRQTPIFRNTIFSTKKFQGKKLLEFVTPLKKSRLNQERAARVIQSHFRGFHERKNFLKDQITTCLQERSASIIQSHFRGFHERKKFMKIKMAACSVQIAVRAYLAITSKQKLDTVSHIWSVHQPSYEICDGYLKFIIERHMFVRSRKSAILIQQAARAWLRRKNQQKDDNNYFYSITAVTSIQSFVRGWIVRSRYVDLLSIVEKKKTVPAEYEDDEHLWTAAIKIQSSWKRFSVGNLYTQKRLAAMRIQAYWRGWCFRKNFLCQVCAVTKIQAGVRCVIFQNAFIRYISAATEIQSFVRGQISRRKLLGASHISYRSLCFGSYNMDGVYLSHELKIVMDSILKLQRWWKQVSLIKSRTASVILIQSLIRGWNARRTAWKKMHSISKIQRWWRHIFLIKSRKKSVILIQAYVRGWIARRTAERDKHNIVIIQAYWKGYIVRKNSRKQVADVRLRLQMSSVNDDYNNQLINKLVAALLELDDHKSVSNIRHTCATLNTATKLSQRCCETLVSAGAINILLRQFHVLNRGVPDQEVLRHVVCTLRNISCYPQLLQELIDAPQAVEIIFQELLRNKTEVFFVAYDLLKKVCETQDGLKAIRRLHVHIRRLNSIVHDLERKLELQNRNARLCTGKDNTVRRLRAAADLLSLISNDHQ